MAGASIGAGPEVVNDADCVGVVGGKVVDELGSTTDDLFFGVLDCVLELYILYYCT